MSATPGSGAAPARGEILVGTSGYSFRDWVGPFYPPGTRAGDFLAYYSERFPCVEVNATYYAVPEPAMLDRMQRKTPDRYRFIVKLHQSFTHDRALDPATVRKFQHALAPLKIAGKYDGLLAQFPWSFRRTPGHRRHLVDLREAFADEPLFVEFRHDSWLTPELEPSLRRHHLGFCAVDEPQLPGMLPPVAMVTAEDAYVRFHGRNARAWYGGDRSTRYDYSYSREELGEWVRRIGELAEQSRRVYLFFNNCHAGQAARSAKLMQELLRQQGLAT